MNEIDTAQDIDQTLAGLTEEERQDVRLGRAHRAREARMLAHWAAVAADLSGAAITGLPEFEGEDWDKVARRFRDRIEPHWLGEDDIEEFAFALMRALGFQKVAIRGHRDCWER
jgi:hypothetical protein